MKRRALRVFLTHFDLAGFMVVREHIALAVDIHPQHVLGFGAVGHDLYCFVVVFAPKNCPSESQRYFFDISSMMVCSIHYPAKVLPEFLDFCDGQCHCLFPPW